jgi:hypothetical protein
VLCEYCNSKKSNLRNEEAEMALADAKETRYAHLQEYLLGIDAEEYLKLKLKEKIKNFFNK